MEQRRTKFLSPVQQPQKALLDYQIHRLDRERSQMTSAKQFGRWSLERYIMRKILQGIHGEILGQDSC